MPLGPFTYVGMRGDDPNDVIPHESRRELRGSKVLAAWLNHWDAREQNSMDMWDAQNAKDKRSSPGIVRHYILDTSDTLGGDSGGDELTRRLGDSFAIDLSDFFIDFFLFGAVERPWDTRDKVKGHEHFAYFSAEEFEPAKWKTLYPNPAFHRMTERDAAWMTRIIARFSPDDVLAVVEGGHFQTPGDADYIWEAADPAPARDPRALPDPPLAARRDPRDRRRRAVRDRLRAPARGAARDDLPVRDRRAPRGDARTAIPAEVGADGQLCFQPRHVAPAGGSAVPDGDPSRIATYEITNGTEAGPIEIQTYDLEARGTRLAGAVRKEPN